jgi:hypothetical protein
MTDVFKSIKENVSRITEVHELAAFIMEKCSGACFDTATKPLEEDFRFLEIFENSIGAVVSTCSLHVVVPAYF